MGVPSTSVLPAMTCKFFQPLLGMCILALLSMSARGALVADIYRARVQVDDRSIQSQQSATRNALIQVLIKASGSESTLELEPVREALQKSRDYVQQYFFTHAKEAPEVLFLQVEFYRQRINELITRAGAPLWTVNRPQTLVWLVLDDGVARHFLNRDMASDQIEVLQQVFDERGLPLRLPLYDLQDAATLSPEQAWRLDVGALQLASKRYGHEDVLAGRLSRLSGDRWLGEWLYLSDLAKVSREVSANDVQTMLRAGASMVAEELSSRYAMSVQHDREGAMAVEVSGVRNFRDYARIMQYLEGIEVVQYANVTHVLGDIIRLELEAQVGLEQLRAVIELNEQFQVDSKLTDEGKLVYRWQK